MDNEQFLQHLRDLSLEEGRAYIQEHAAELADAAGFGMLLKDEALRQQNINPLVSLKLAEILLFFGEYIHHPTSHALGLIAKGDALRFLGHHQAAVKFLDAAGEEFRQLHDEVGWARSRMGWILSAAWLGRTEEALQEAVRAHEVLLQHGEYSRACMLDNNTAIIYTRLGRYQEALTLYERVRVMYHTLTDQSETYIKRSLAMTESNQANNLFWLGRFEEAYHLMQQAQISFLALGEPRFIIATEMNLADYDDAQSYYGSALRRYYQARDSAIKSNIDDPVLLAELKLRMTGCLVRLNRPQEACQLALEAVETYKQIGMSLDTGAALHEYAGALVASHQLKAALTVLDEAWTLFHSGGFDHYAFATRLQQAEVLLDMGSIAAAYEQANLVNAYFAAKGLVAHFIRACLVMASALIESVQHPGVCHEKEQTSLLLNEAVLLCRQSALQAHQHNLQELVYRSQYLLGRLAALQENPVRAARHYGAAIAQIERIMDDLVFDLSPSFLHTAWNVYADMIALCLQQDQTERAFSYLEQARSVALRQSLNKSNVLQSKSGAHEDTIPLSVSQANRAMVLRMQRELKEWQERYRDYSVLLTEVRTSVSPTINREVIEGELKQCEAKISELFERLHLHQFDATPIGHAQKRSQRKAQQLSVAQIREHLVPDQLVLTYFLYQSKLIIFALTTEQLLVFENPDGATQLERLLPLLQAHLHPGGWSDIQRPPLQAITRLLHKLYTLLIAPVAALLPSSAGYLTIIPYGPLHDLPFHALHDGRHFLIEDCQIHYLPASSLLTRLRNWKNEAVLTPGDSVHSPLIFGYSENGHLQRVIDETCTLTELLDGRCYLEADATIAHLARQAPGSPIIHLATHGHNRTDAPNFSYVRLADGQLNAIDAFSLDLGSCELVTLSGCETGLARSGGGDEQLGLGRAFLAAGAASLVMSLWQVEDNSTNELMRLFYQHLLHGDTKVQALRAAQCTLLHSNSSRYAHPYFWAAFRLVGDTRPLHFRRAKKTGTGD